MNRSNHYLCIHGHFYQPPRENPWLEAIDYQESASPYHDWNERISTECYRSNGLSRILDNENWVIHLTNNYGRVSFNFGPTLLSWMEEHDPEAYKSILAGDKKSVKRYGGHGSALAQVYNHIIMPLASRRDKETQVIWGIKDFQKRFGRDPEAMWLAETAVDTETLEVLAEHGMKYVILAPNQAQAVRPLEGNHLWNSVRGGRIDTHQPYLVRLPGGKSIAAFFYNGVISQAVAFEGLLNNGETFANRLGHAFDGRGTPQILHIATDGESYGHHHLRGDMALAYAINYIQKHNMATLTNYGQFLELFPPTQEAQIVENSSWSCIHGVERWNSDCGCSSGMKPGWNQKWRRPLREAMNFLRDHFEKPYEELASQYVEDPWGLRNGYIDVILDRSFESRMDFFRKWLRPDIEFNQDIEETLLKALELQRNLLLVYTSCAWFFDEVSGVETVQNMGYAARALELGQELFGDEIETDFIRLLSAAPSNIPDFEHGGKVYERFVLPSRMDYLKIAAHLGALALFKEKIRDGHFNCYDYKWGHVSRTYSGKAQLVCGHLLITSRITREERNVELVAVHLGDHNLNVGVLPFSGIESYTNMVEDFSQAFSRGDLAKAVRLLDKYYEGNILYLNDLFHEQQKEIIQKVFSQTLSGVEEQFSSIYDQHYPVMSYLSDIHVALPPVFSHIAHFVQNKHIDNELHEEEVNVDAVKRYLQEAKQWDVPLDAKQIEHTYIAALARALKKCISNPQDFESFRSLNELADLAAAFPFQIDLGEIQNAFATWIYTDTPEQENLKKEEWESIALRIGKILKVRIEALKSNDKK